MSLRRSSRSAAVTNAAPAITNGNATALSRSTKKRSAQAHPAEEGINSTDEQAVQDAIAMPPPSTPVQKKRRVIKQPAPPPLTPTPSAIGVMLDTTHINGTQVERPAEPQTTNAVLNTAEESPSRSLNPPSTTSNLLDDAIKHLLKVDPELKPLIDRHHCKVFSPEGLNEVIDPFTALVSGILSQQVSGAAAKSIKNKFIALFPPEDCSNGFPLPAMVAVTALPRLREAGLSQRKAEYVQGLAQKFASGELTVNMLMNGSDEEVMEKLVAVRGLGVWSVEMFMCFALKRMDILSTGDLGVQRGMAAYVGRDVNKLKNKGGKWKYMSEADMISISEKFSPYRSLFMWYMWRIEDVDTAALGDS